MNTQNYCRTCKFFTGCGDWNLCCTNPPPTNNWCGFLCYEDTPACQHYRAKEIVQEFVNQVNAGKLPSLEMAGTFGLEDLT